MDEHGIARLMRELEIDIAVDLDGYSINSKPKIFAYRPAPLAVNYLGYPGTVGSPMMDYIIADHTIIPDDEQPFYDEKVVYLPHTYQANARRSIASHTFTREEAGLPENAFVFCCFNSAHKITPIMFDVWMRLLKCTNNSVLWLMGSDPVLQANLRREAMQRGVDAQRVIFAGRLLADLHLARHSLADLFLDTLPYNAHTTASDALWAGLPVVTCTGNNFPGRVCAGILGAIELDELITPSLEAYEALALALAHDPARLAAVKERLVRYRDTTPLFDCAAYTRQLESAYRTMWQRQQDGKAPESFAV
jgi:predicted O-linked N-acetylglucosamine transferase (SPINDLY family)